MNWPIFVYSLVTLIFYGAKIIDSANILVIMPLAPRSHFKSFQPLWEELIERGHNLTLVAGHKLSDKFQLNYTLVDVRPYFITVDVEYAELRKQGRFQHFRFVHDVVHDFCETIFEAPEVQRLIDSNEKYDLVASELFFIDAIFAFGYKFNAPTIAVSPHTMISCYNWVLSNPFPASYEPNSFLPLTEKMSFTDRVVNAAFSFYTVLLYEFVIIPRSQSLVEKYFHFEEGNVPHIKDIMKNISVAFVNSHYSLGYVKPLLPNVVNVAGLHFTPLKTLPKNIQKFMDDAEYGVVYLSFGSLIQPNEIKDLGEVLIKILEKIPQRVIMKWEPKLLSHIPDNILVQEWIPQVEVLNHPNCRLFITHGGLHSLLESLNASVPLIGVPFFTDQNYNMAVVEYHGIGVAIDFDNIPNELSSKIDDLLYNLKYKKNIEKRSQLFRERLTNPLETAVYWVEYVIQNKNTAHLKPASSQLYWYELYSLDVLIIVAVVIWVLIKIVKLIIGKMTQKFISIPIQAHKAHSNGTLLQKETNNRLKYE